MNNISVAPFEPLPTDEAVLLSLGSAGYASATMAELPIFDDSYSLEIKLLMTFIFLTLSIVGIVGNIMVIIVVTTVRGMVSTTNCYLVSLAAADSLFFFASVPTEISDLYTSSYAFNSPVCSSFTFLPYFALTSSVLSITAFTVERYLGICCPYKQLTWCSVQRSKSIIRGIWLFSLIYNAPWFFLAHVDESGGMKQCTFRLHRDNWTYKAIYLFDFFSFYAIPMLLNVVIYAKIAVEISRCGEKMKHTVKNAVAKESPTKQAGGSNDFHVTGSTRVAKGRNSVVKMLAIVVAVFAICWLPYKAMVMHNSFTSREDKWDSISYIFFAKTMIFINCAINPILYNVMSRKFRMAFIKLLSGKRQSRRDASPTKSHPTLVTPQRGVSSAMTRDDERSALLIAKSIDKLSIERCDRVSIDVIKDGSGDSSPGSSKAPSPTPSAATVIRTSLKELEGEGTDV